MKKIFLVVTVAASLLLQSFAPKAPVTSWKLDKSHSSVSFAVDHLVISETKGEFNDFTAEVKSDLPDFTDATFTLNIKVNSINTKDENRDKHLKSADFFDSEKYPEIIFVGKKFTKVKGSEYKVEGALTMHGVTKIVTLNAKFGGIVKDPWGGTRTGVTVSGELDRYDFGLKYNAAMEAGGMTIGQLVRINCSVELIKG